MASLSSNAASSSVDASPGRITPVLLAQEWRERIHNTGECIDVRNGVVHSMKACTSTKSRKWTNTIRTETASIEMNLTTQKMNNYVMRATAPFHLISYGSGANTMYHGRWKYVKRGTLPPNSYRKARYTFELAYVDDGNASSMIQKEENRRSSYEREWASAFENLSLHAAAYEPATFANIYDTEQGTIREYTPDFFLPEISCWIDRNQRPACYPHRVAQVRTTVVPRLSHCAVVRIPDRFYRLHLGYGQGHTFSRRVHICEHVVEPYVDPCGSGGARRNGRLVSKHVESHGLSAQ